MKKLALMGICLAAASQPALAADAYEASAGTTGAFEIRSTEPEVDALFKATCVVDTILDVRFGGEMGLGKGELEPTSLTITDGALTSRVDGVSVRSPDFEMTGGSMLLTSIESDGRAMRILVSGKPITFTPKGGKPEKITLGKQATDALKAFMAKCKDG